MTRKACPIAATLVSALNLCGKDGQDATAPAKRARRKEARPGELLAAALTLFVEKGYAATRVEEVAQLAGVSKGTLFLYFANKEELFKAVVRENLAGHFPEWNAEFDAWSGNASELLEFALRAWWDRVGSTPVAGITKLMMSEAANFPELAAFYENEVMVPGRLLVQRILRLGVARGEFRPIAPADMQYAAYAVMAPMLFLMTWKHSFGACAAPIEVIDPLRYLEQQARILLNGLCASTAPAAA
ncbi:TetR family transcriptional regulator [Hylemonella gracilis str. Niagara R]|uniref:TetR family transcriptional regulator n=1 Tax=Hylemonella gracilis str. Niagara R TaxID=1458275 RepID=A0A016XFG9_9BURK|nr:TetR/AcrR family transcriptional regulator [Hylemonella gracilis]EYC50536.1 TetR family transcriptional regulator [Hylemonella gracilis str. Niagara R]